MPCTEPDFPTYFIMLSQSEHVQLYSDLYLFFTLKESAGSYLNLLISYILHRRTLRLFEKSGEGPTSLKNVKKNTCINLIDTEYKFVE